MDEDAMEIVSLDMPKFLFDKLALAIETTTPLKVIKYPDAIQNGEITAYMVAPSLEAADRIIKSTEGA